MGSPVETGSVAAPDATAEFRVPREWRPSAKTTGSKGVRAPVRPAYAPVPLPSTDEELFAYRKRGMAKLMIPSFVSFGCLIASQVLFMRLAAWLWVLGPLMIFALIYYSISLCVNIFTPGFDVARHQELVKKWRPRRYPSVDVFLPVCGEPPHVLRNTWDFVRAMGRHYRGNVTVYVLDDSPTEAMERMALAFGFVYQRRPNRGWFKKAGNMRYAFERTLGDFILVLDADFTPRHDMLDQMLPYFDVEPTVGIVRSPQYFRTQSYASATPAGSGYSKPDT